MPCDPEIVAFFDHVTKEMNRFAATGGLTVDERRWRAEQYATLTAERHPPELATSQMYITLKGREVPVLMHRPQSEGPLPAILFFHGGSYVAGSPQSHDFISASIAHFTGAIVLSVHYRRAPENPYPAPTDDCYAALCWAATHAARLGIDPARIAVAGDSAGGSLAAACTLLARDRDGPVVAHQTLIYPGLGAGSQTDSYRNNTEDLFLKPQGIEFAQRAFLGDAVPDAYSSPLRAASHARLPRAYVLVAELDPLHDDGVLYVDRLKAAGVTATLRTAPGMVHGFVRARRWSKVAQAEFEAMCADIRDGLGLPVPVTSPW